MIKFKMKSTFFGGLPVRLMTEYGGKHRNAIPYVADNMCTAAKLILKGAFIVLFIIAVLGAFLAAFVVPVLVWVAWMIVNSAFIFPSMMVQVSALVLVVGVVWFGILFLYEEVKLKMSEDRVPKESNTYKIYRAYKEKYCMGVDYE